MPADPLRHPIVAFAAAAAQHAPGLAAVVGADAAALFSRGLDEAEGTARVLTAASLEAAVVEGRTAMALLQGVARAALAYLAVLEQGGEQVVGLRIDCREGDSAKVYVFGAPLAVDPARGPVLRGELWALNPAAQGALGPGRPAEQ